MTLGNQIALAVAILITAAHIFIEHAIKQIASEPTWDGSSGISTLILVFFWCLLLIPQIFVALTLFSDTFPSELASCCVFSSASDCVFGNRSQVFPGMAHLRSCTKEEIFFTPARPGACGPPSGASGPAFAFAGREVRSASTRPIMAVFERSPKGVPGQHQCVRVREQ